jgi:hypothetical protein
MTCQPNDQWYEMQDLHVTETLPQMVRGGGVHGFFFILLISLIIYIFEVEYISSR